MRAPTRTVLLALMGLAATVVVAVDAPARADEAAYDHAVLDLTGLGDIAVDQVRGLAYLSGGPSDDRIVVARGDGSLASEITGVTGATDLALDADGSTLWAAVPGADAIARIDTASSAVRLFPTGPDTCPSAVAPVGEEVWYAEDAGCDAQFEVIRALDPTTGTTRRALGPYPAGDYYRPALRSLPGSDRLLINEQGVTGGDLDVVDPAAGTVVASTQLPASPGDLAVAPDGSEVLVGHWDWPSHVVEAYRLSDLTRTRTLNFDQQWTSGRVAGDADLLALRSDSGRVGVFERATGDLLNAIRFGPEWQPAIAGMALVQGRLLAVSVAGGQVRLFHSAEPGVEGTSVTAVSSDPALAGHPVTLSGSVVDGGAPLPGVGVRVLAEDGTLLDRTTTTADGTWQVSRTWPTPTWQRLLVVADAEAPHKPAVTTLEVLVQKVPSGLTVSGPDTVAPGAPVDLTGRLVSDGHGVNAPLDWDVHCASPYSLLGEGSTPTGTDGTFELSWTPPPASDCADLRFWFRYAGDDTTAGSEATHAVAVSWHRASVDLAAPSSAWLLDDVPADLTVTVDGEPAAGVTVETTWTGPEGTTTADATSGPDGSVALSLPTAAKGAHTLTAVVERTPDTLGATSSAAVDVRQVSSSLDFAPTVAEISVGDTVQLEGSLHRADGRNAGVRLQVIAVDADSHRRDSWVTTGPDGRFTATDTPAVAGTSTYWVRDVGDGVRYLPSDPRQRTTVSVQPVAPRLRMSTDRTSYAAGQVMRVVLEAPAAPGAVVTVTAERDGTTREVFRGTVPDSGTAFDVPARSTTTLTASAAATSTTTAATRSLTRPVRLGLGTRAVGGTTSGAWQVYPTSVDPVLLTRVAPHRGGCLRYDLQRRAADGWRAVSTSACHRIEDARARFVLTGTHAAAARYRVRPEFAGDARNAATRGAWTRLLFRD